MTRYELFLFISITAFQVLLCVLVYFRGLQRRLPFFAAYATVMPGCSLFLGFVFGHYGFRAAVSYYAFWIAAAATMFARSAAIAELCRYSLQAYQGIWALTWRVLGLMALFFFVHAALDAQGQPDWIATYGLTIERDVEITSVVILLAILVIGDYYHIRMDALLKWICVGICFFCGIEFVNNTVLRDALIKYMVSWTTMKLQVDRVNQLWNTVRASTSIISIGIWCFALRKPLAAPARAPELLPAEVYGTFSPAVNMRLRAFNDRLVEMLKP